MNNISFPLINSLVKKLVIISLILLLGLRIYALFFTIPIVTPWDDTIYRNISIKESKEISLKRAARLVFLPNPEPPIRHGVMRGYTQQLTLGLKLFGQEKPETSFHLVNISLLLIQSALIFFFGWWAIADYLWALILSFLYLSSPIVFGINRWVMTENFVLAGLLVFSLVGAKLLTTKNERAYNNQDSGKWNFKRKEIVLSALAAYAIGICSTIREYAIPSLFVISASIVLGLLWDKRRVAAITFISVLLPFLIAISNPLYICFKNLASKSVQLQYFHPLGKWTFHVFLYVMGPAMTLLLIPLLVFIPYHIFKNVFRLAKDHPSTLLYQIKQNITGIHFLLAGHGLLIVLYGTAIALSTNRVVRPAIPLMISILGFVLIGIYSIPPIKALILTPPIKLFALSLIVLSWAVLSYQLFFAFEGGKTYAHHAFNLEFYNYPLHLRPLRDSNDTYICGEKGIICPYQLPK
jgi:hypothetical protein